MGARMVIKMGNPILGSIASPVDDFGSGELDALIADLWDTMKVEGGVGIAAPQVGVSRRVVVFGLDEHPCGADVPSISYTVLINPVITVLDDEVEDGWEGCLSVPGMRGVVPRHQHIRYAGVDALGAPFEREVDGYHARVVQHECDHLDGVLYPQRMRDLKQFGYTDEFERVALASVAARSEEE